jgi:lysyl-tRNA synthetase class 1
MSPPIPNLTALSADAKAWPFEQARAVLKRVEKRDPALPVIFETGYGPSGLPHIGTFGEVARTTMVRRAFEALTEGARPTRLIAFSDDMDGFRKVPTNLPNAEMLKEYLGKPLTRVPDPFGTHESFAHHNNARLCAFLDSFGFEYEFYSATQQYTSGAFDAVLLRMLERFDDVMAIMLPTLGAERQATYSPFLPVSPTSGNVLQVPTLERNVSKGTIVFLDEDGTKQEVPVTGGHVKVQWKPDWALRWTALGVDYEMAGKDLTPSVQVSSRIAKVLGCPPPEGFAYELFLDENGEKISKSKGNGLSVEEWLTYGPPESLSYFMFGKPKTAKRLYFDQIPRAVDEYLQQLDAYAGQDAAQRLDNPVWHIHGGHPPEAGSPVTFGLLLNLVSAAGAADKGTIWGFIVRYAPEATPETHPFLDRLVEGAVAYYRDFVAPTQRRRAPTAMERAAMEDLLTRLRALEPSETDAELIQAEVYEAGKSQQFENLRDWFKALYEVLFGQSQGPRFGGFAAIFGLPGTINMIESALAEPASE